MEHFFHGEKFNNVEYAKNACTEFFASKSKDWYQEGIKQSAKRWKQTINSDGLYDIGCKHYILNKCYILVLNSAFFIEHPNTGCLYFIR